MDRATRRAKAASTLLVLGGLVTGFTASAKPPRAASPVTISFHEAVALAWAHLPQRREFEARQSVAAARATSGSAFFPNAPVLSGTYVNDRIAGSNYNYVTNQLEFSTPLWLPGQGSATLATAQADGVAATAALDAARLVFAAQLLDLASQAVLASNTRDVSRRRLSTAQALAVDLGHRFQVGESSQSDALAADADASSAGVALATADGQLGVALASLAALTGSTAVPRLDMPPAVSGVDTLARHPRIAAAERAVAAALANARLVRIGDRDSPELGLQGVNEKQPGSKWDTRFGVVFRLPFTSEARNAPLRAVADQATTQAEVQLAIARREVLADIQRADALLSASQRSAAAAERGAAELEKRRGQIERAWRLGEMPLIEVVRADSVTFDAVLARDKARTELAAARIRMSLAEGVQP